MASTSDSRKLVDFIESLGDFVIRSINNRGYGHMGATITDSILQAGLNYRTVVEPRVRAVLEAFPFAKTSTEFLGILKEHGANNILSWKHPEKPRRVNELTTFFVAESVDTEECLGQYLSYAFNCEKLLTLNGIGPKTVDYLKNFAGIPTIAVDRHISHFVAVAGISCSSYEEISRMVCIAADLLATPASDLDFAIWDYVSQGRLTRVIH